MAFLALLCLSPASRAAITDKELDNNLQAAKLLHSGEKISASVGQDEVIVRKYKSTDAPVSRDYEKDCKIEAVLIARVVLEADSSAKKVKVRFFESKDPLGYAEIVVQPIHIKSFASGAISQNDLLSSLELSYGVEKAVAQSPALSAVSVADGPLKEQRADLLTRINKMAEQGVNTQAYLNLFAQLEESARKGEKTTTLDLFDKLNTSVNDQQKALERRLRPQTTAAARASKNEPGLPPAPGTEGGETEHTSRFSLENLGEMNMEQLAYKFFKKRYGVFTPARGPFQEERNYIAGELIKRQNQGLPVKQFEPMCNELNAYAKANDLATLRSKITNAYRFLHIPSLHEQMSKGGWHGHHYDEH